MQTLKAVCPKSGEHKRFVTTAHILEEWLVDEAGNWVKTLESLETTHRPDPDNVWTCYVCGAPAKVERVP